MKSFFLFLALFSFTVFAADVTGTWKGTAETENGKIERTFNFKVAGTTLTGDTTSSMMGKSTIENGKVDGDNISFTIVGKIQDNDVKLEYKGKVAGDEIKLHVEGGNGFSLDYTLKKAS